jgi:heme-degrading monooxygenase HmoA
LGYYAVIFTSLRTDIDTNEYSEMSQKMVAKTKTQKGFLGVDSARGSDGVGITISYWDSLENIKAWKNDDEHLNAQELGRQKWYESFSVRICKVEHEYGSEK